MRNHNGSTIRLSSHESNNDSQEFKVTLRIVRRERN